MMLRFDPEFRNEWITYDNYELRSIHLCTGDFGYKAPGIRSQMRLSILICTIPEREDDFVELWQHLAAMHRGLPESLRRKVEVIAIRDNRKMTIGDKRNLLLDYACGEYVCFIDDDDWISNSYMSQIMLATQKKTDAIGFEVKCENYPAKGRITMASVGVLGSRWEERGGHIFRPPYHKTPVKRDIALSAKFPSKSYGEDAEYSKRISPFIQTSHHINETLYIYNSPTNPTLSRYKQN